LFEAICNRLGVITDEIVSLDHPIGNEKNQVLADIVPEAGIPIEAVISSKQIAENIYEQLSDRQREILWLHFSAESPNLVEIGSRLNISKSTVGNELSDIEAIVLEGRVDESDIDPVLYFLKELLAKHRSNHRFS
jgi:DNA-directed RNA polymerase specialized sigma subunit